MKRKDEWILLFGIGFIMGILFGAIIVYLIEIEYFKMGLEGMDYCIQLMKSMN